MLQIQTHPLLHTFRNETNSLVKIHHAGRGNVSSFLLKEICFKYLKALNENESRKSKLCTKGMFIKFFLIVI